MSTDPLIGKKLGDYVIVDMLGNGGMARVYRGFDDKLNRYAAVKVFDAHLIGEGDQDEYRVRFQNEARSIARLSHPNIVGVYQFGLLGTTYYMAMSIVEGRDLRSHIKSYAKKSTYMPYVDMLRIIRDIGSALDYAHQEGVIHRDVKPSNIMVTPGGRAVLTDFGLALNVSEGTIGATFGSAHYIAPEQALSSAQAVPQSDLYSLGVVLFEMLTNRVPFSDPSAMTVALKHINDVPPPPSQINPNLSHQIDEVLAKALQKTPAKRFVTGAAFTEALEDAFALSSGAHVSAQFVKGLPSWDGDSRPSAGSRSRLSASTERDTVILADTATASKLPSLLDDLSPVADGKITHATRTGIVLQKKQRRMWAAVSLMIILVVAVGAAALLNTSREQAVANQDATGTAQANLIASSTQAQVVAMAATEVVTETDIPMSPTPLVVSIPSETNALLAGGGSFDTSSGGAITLTPTNTPSPTPSPTFTATATIEQAETETVTAPTTTMNTENASILLRYDANSLVLLNQSQADVDVSGLVFIQVKADGTELIFETERWEGGSRPPASLPPGDCFEVLKDSDFGNTAPDYCGTRHAWSRVTFPRWFWVSSDAEAVFEVRRGDIVLATCPISAGECALAVDPED